MIPPGEHSTCNIDDIGEPKRLQNHGCLSAPVATAAIQENLLFPQMINRFSISNPDVTQRQQDATDIEFSVLSRLTHINQVQRFASLDLFIECLYIDCFHVAKIRFVKFI